MIRASMNEAWGDGGRGFKERKQNFIPLWCDAIFLRAQSSVPFNSCWSSCAHRIFRQRPFLVVAKKKVLSVCVFVRESVFGEINYEWGKWNE